MYLKNSIHMFTYTYNYLVFVENIKILTGIYTILISSLLNRCGVTKIIRALYILLISLNFIIT